MKRASTQRRSFCTPPERLGHGVEVGRLALGWKFCTVMFGATLSQMLCAVVFSIFLELLCDRLRRLRVSDPLARILDNASVRSTVDGLRGRGYRQAGGPRLCGLGARKRIGARLRRSFSRARSVGGTTAMVPENVCKMDQER